MSPERIALNTITLPGDLDGRLTAAKQAGFGAIGLWEKDLRGYPHGPQAAKHQIDWQGFSVPEFFALKDWQLTTGDARTAAFRQAKEFFAFMAGLGLETAVVVPTLDRGTMEQAVRDLRELADLAAAHHIRLAFEFLAWAEWLCDLATSWELVQQVDDVGLVIDSLHFFKSRSSLDDLRRIPVERISIVHMADAPDREMDLIEMARHHRLFPGEGTLPLAAMVSVLREKGYAGWYAIEIFNDEYWKREPKKLAEEAMTSMRKLLG